MTKVEKYIQDYTRGCSNEMAAIKYADGRTETYYHEWLTPENALSVAEMAKEETLNKVCEWLDKNVAKYLVDTSIHGVKVTGIHISLTEDLRKVLEE